MNSLQRKAASDATPTAQGGGHAIARTRLVLGGLIHVAGTVISAETLASIAGKNLAAMLSSKLIELRPGPPPEGARPPTPQQVEDPKAVAAAQKAALERAGYAPWETTAGIPTPVGPFVGAPPGPAAAAVTATGQFNALSGKG